MENSLNFFLLSGAFVVSMVDLTCKDRTFNLFSFWSLLIKSRIDEDNLVYGTNNN